MGACVIQVSVKDESEAESIAASLLDQRLAAAVNIVGGMTSMFHWEGAIHRRSEVLLLAKTRDNLVEASMAHIRERHSYQCPSILALPVAAGDPAYLDWLASETAQSNG